jgi:hypothetical protein
MGKAARNWASETLHSHCQLADGFRCSDCLSASVGVPHDSPTRRRHPRVAEFCLRLRAHYAQAPALIDTVCGICHPARVQVTLEQSPSASLLAGDATIPMASSHRTAALGGSSADLHYTPVADIATIVSGARAAYESGRTRSLKWRRAQISAIQRMMEENLDAIADALHADLRRPKLESVIAEVRAHHCLPEKRRRGGMGGRRAWERPERGNTEQDPPPGTAGGAVRGAGMSRAAHGESISA